MSKKILATIENTDFIGRTVEFDALRGHADGEMKSNGLLFLSVPSGGASELLRQTYDQLFREQSDLIPIYFAVNETDKSAKNCASRFLNSFLAQLTAFRRNDEKILDGSPNLAELLEMSAPDDEVWAKRIVANCQMDDEIGDDRACVRGCLSAPLRAAAHGAKFFVMFDDLHSAAFLTDEIDFLEELKDIYSRANVRFIFSGRRRFLYGARRMENSAEILRLEPLNFIDAGFLTESLARRFNVPINEQTRDLIVRKLDGVPAFIKFLIQAAREKNLTFDNFAQVEKLYTDELFGGAFGRFYDETFWRIAPNVETQRSLIGLIHKSLTTTNEKIPLEWWQDEVGLGDAEFYCLMSLLNSAEIVRVSSNTVEAMPENEVLSDYIRARFRLEIAAEKRALVVGEMLSEFLKRAPQTMAKFYRQTAAIGLRELLTVFNHQEIPSALLDYSLFAEHYKGAETAEIYSELENKEAERLRLPHIVYAAHTVAFYPPLENLTEKTRSAVALGFGESIYNDADETVWLAAEIESKLEASKELTEFWCDRLEMVALVCNFVNYKLWLVAPEGFTPEASEVLRARNSFGSSRKQVELLIKFLKAETIVGEKQAAHEYEIVVPMDDETELIAANAVEEIAKRHQFSPKAVNQIKTALVEACINAAEHSLSPDGKIYQKFTFETDKLIILVSNRGLRIADKQATEITPDEGRRGWGIKLMKTLMDEVKFEQVDDGTRISMTKYLK